jgi:RecQ family ATP-dependent DNA helicase
METAMETSMVERRTTVCLGEVARELGYPSLSTHQQEAILKFVSGTDVLVVLPTGSGKSICFAVLPRLFDSLRGHMRKSIAVVVTPLNSLMKDQVMSLSERGLKSAFVNASAISEDPELASRLGHGEYQLVYIGPEMLLETAWCREMLLNDVYKDHLIAFVIDEAHCIKSWGVEFRRAFKKLGEARSIMSSYVHVMALTATAVKETRQMICNTLCMDKSTHVIMESPLRSNIRFIVCQRKPNFLESKDFLKPLLNHLTILRTRLPRTIIFCQRYKDCTSIYDYFRSELGPNFTEPPQSPDLAAFRLVDMYMSTTADDVKEEISQDFRDTKGHIRVLICTSAFGMGIDCKGVENVYHWGAPSDIEMYVQEVGRGGRNMEKCTAMLFVKPSEVKGAYETFCSGGSCRRLTLEAIFQVPHIQPLDHWCCDICDSVSHAV